MHFFFLQVRAPIASHVWAQAKLTPLLLFAFASRSMSDSSEWEKDWASDEEPSAWWDLVPIVDLTTTDEAPAAPLSGTGGSCGSNMGTETERVRPRLAVSFNQWRILWYLQEVRKFGPARPPKAMKAKKQVKKKKA